jgi:chemotaxis signal transduction protein
MQPINAPTSPAAAPAPETTRAGLARMAVRVGQLALLLPWDGGREVMPAPASARIPHTVAWLRGIANVRGALVPVVDLAAALGVERAALPAYLLICGEGETALGLLIDGLPRVLEIDAANRIPDRPVLAALLDDCVVAAYQQDGRAWLDLDLPSLFESLAARIAQS